MGPLFARARDLLCRFLAWWGTELLALVPEPVRRILPRRCAVVVEAGPTELVVVRRSGERRREIARLPGPDPAAGGTRQPLLKGHLLRAGHHEVILQLPADRALRKTLSLPTAAEGNLAEILHFELDRQTPFRPEEVYFDCRVLERLPGAQRITVELTVLARSVVDPILAWLARWHLEPARVESAGDAGDQGWACRLPARGGDPGRERSRTAGVLTPALAVLTLVLAATAVYMPIARQQHLLAQLQDQLRTEARLAEATSALQEQLVALRGEALQVARKKSDGAAVLAIWNEVARVIPDHSFALELRLREGVVELVGQSRDATALLEVVEASPLFHGAAFRSPITRGPGAEAERFHLAFSVRTPVAAQEDGP